MVAYFALASFVPLVFLALAVLSLVGAADETSLLVQYLEQVFPGTSVERIAEIVAAVLESAGTLGIVGAVALGWSSLSLFSALESVFNLVYDRPNRGFLRGKALATVAMGLGLVGLFAALVVGTLGHDLLRRHVSDALGNRWVALALGAVLSGIALLVFLLAAYSRLTNAMVSTREALPGAALATVVLVPALQALPVFVFATSGLVTLQALGATFLLLLWLYVMANVIVFGAVLNWQLTHGATGVPVLPRREPTEKR
ncbi:MAG: YihY/virulence factor BrkB family protein [Thermoleophilia bacterium]|nr:YihY/virulence factor BrkB family protein [Thermoleophilia bacterium]